jgi:autotransporter-associated beta strand protein
MKEFAAVGLCLGLAGSLLADVAWNGGAGAYTDGANWAGGAVPASTNIASIGAGGQATFDTSDALSAKWLVLGNTEGAADPAAFVLLNGSLTLQRLYEGYLPGSFGETTQSGGTLTVTDTSDPAFSVGYATNATGTGFSTYRLQGGTLNVTSGGNVGIGSYGRGRMEQTGGTFDSSCWFVLGRYPGGYGEYDLSAGLLTQQNAARGIIIGEQGSGKLTVRGTGELQDAGGLRISEGAVYLTTGGVIRAASVFSQDAGKSSAVHFDGGTLAAFGPAAAQNAFITGLTEGAFIGNGGLTVQIDEGRQATVPQNLLPDGDSAGGLVKTGAGVLALSGNNTYTGGTTVAQGVLAAIGATAVPGLSDGKATVASGAALSLDAAVWSGTALAALLQTDGLFAAGSSFGLDTRNGSVTLNDTLPPNSCAGFVKTGDKTLTLAGANAYTGDTTIYGGILQAEKGAGIPAASHIVLAGGSWAPVNEPQMTRALGTGTDELGCVPGTAAGFAAIGSPLTVNIGGAAADISLATAGGFGTGGLTLNDTGSDQPLTFMNGLDISGSGLTVTVNSTDANAPVTFTGGIHAEPAAEYAHSLTKAGDGALVLSGPVSLPTNAVFAAAGSLTFSNNAAAMMKLECNNGSTTVIKNGARVAASSNAYIGRSGTGSTMLDIADGSLDGTNSFNMATDAGTTATLNMTGDGAVIYGGYMALGNFGTATINQTAGLMHSGPANDLGLGYNYDANANKRGSCTYTLSGGELRTDAGLRVGRYGYGDLEQTGGQVYSAIKASIARYAGSSGIYNLLGGTCFIGGVSMVVGEDGIGTWTIGGTGSAEVANGVYVSGGPDSVYAGQGTLNIEDGGTLATTFVRRGAATNGACFHVNGGVLKAAGSQKTYYNFLNGFGRMDIGAKGLILDTADNTVYVHSSFATNALAGGTIIKRGTGTLALDALPSSRGSVQVEEGTLSLKSNRALIHRWSFNGTMEDSAGGQTATPVGAVTYLNDTTEASLAGGSNGGSYISLGTDVLPPDGSPATLEIWGTLRSTSTLRGSIFYLGDTSKNYFYDTWTYNSAAMDHYSLKKDGGTLISANTVIAPFAVGTQYHICVTIEPYIGYGTTRVIIYKQDAATGATLACATNTVSEWSPADLNQLYCWLGHEPYATAPDACASYNEVRVWRQALTEAQLTASALAGPDTLPDLSPAAQDTETLYPANPSEALSANDYLVHRWSFNGDLTDSVGGQDAAQLGTVSALTYNAAKTAVSTPGGASDTAVVSLGADILPADGSPVTLELWGKNRELLKCPRIFNLGGSSSDYIYTAWNWDSSLSKDHVSIHAGGASKLSTYNGMSPFALGTQYHIAMVAVPDTAAGTCELRWYKQDTLTGRTLACATNTVSGWTLASIKQTVCTLGGSSYTADPNAAADYDECRVWNAALSEAQLSANAQLGPDTLPLLTPAAALASAPSVRLSASATLDLAGGSETLRDLAGSGTVANGTLTVTGTLAPDGLLDFTGGLLLNGTLALDPGEQITGTGPIDLRHATLALADPAALPKSGPWTIASSTGGVTGPLKADNLQGTGYGIVYTATEAKLIPLSTVILLR